VQGTYEFEVQPLREYFAARFLYETAPYSPVGSERRGTKPDRFDAIARDFYWLNVTRFYAGCYSKGELASLIDRLGDLIRDPNFSLLSHPRVLAATLLADWVFTQHPKSVSEVLRLILDGIGLRFLLTSNSRRLSNSQALVLPAACGKAELVSKCLSMLRDAPPADYALDVIDLLGANANREELLPIWLTETSKVQGKQRTDWFSYGLHLGCLPNVQSADLQTLLSDCELHSERIDLLLRARRSDILEGSRDHFRRTMDALLERSATVGSNWRQQRLIDSFGQALDATRYAWAFRDTDQEPLAEKWKRRGGRAVSELRSSFDIVPDYPEIPGCRDFIETASNLATRETVRWATELSVWEELVDTIAKRFGHRWIAVHLANIASGIKSSTETCTDCPDLFAPSKSLVRRARYARLRAGSPAWWKKTLDDSDTPEKQLLASLIWFTWASSNTISENIATVDRLVEHLSEDAWRRLFDSVENALELTRSQSGDRQIVCPDDPSIASFSPRTLAVLGLRSKLGSSDTLEEALSAYKGADDRVLKICQASAIERLAHGKMNWTLGLAVLARAYSNGVLSPRFSSYQYARHGGPLRSMPLEIALRTAEKADQYPSFIVAAAEARCRESTASKLRPVALAANEEGWFDPS
jgi:hypothetical protein